MNASGGWALQTCLNDFEFVCFLWWCPSSHHPTVNYDSGILCSCSEAIRESGGIQCAAHQTYGKCRNSPTTQPQAGATQTCKRFAT